MWEVRQDVFSVRNKSNIILLPPNFISWQLKSSTENLTFQKGWFSRSPNTVNKILISAIAEETRLYVIDGRATT